MLGRLRDLPCAILSNGAPRMLEAVVATTASASASARWSASTRCGRSSRTRPSTRSVLRALGLARDAIGFVSSNGWDVAGAKAFGFRVVWVNRQGAPAEELGVMPDLEVRDLGPRAGGRRCGRSLRLMPPRDAGARAPPGPAPDRAARRRRAAGTERGDEDRILAGGVRLEEPHHVVVVEGEPVAPRPEAVRPEVEPPAEEPGREVGRPIAAAAPAGRDRVEVGEEERDGAGVGAERLPEAQLPSLAPELAGPQEAGRPGDRIPDVRAGGQALDRVDQEVGLDEGRAGLDPGPAAAGAAPRPGSRRIARPRSGCRGNSRVEPRRRIVSPRAREGRAPPPAGAPAGSPALGRRARGRRRERARPLPPRRPGALEAS